GNEPEDPNLLAIIGDQDRGHNLLLELNDPRLVSPLRQHLLHLHSAVHGPWERLRPSYNRVIRTEDTAIYLFPRLRRNIIAKKLLTVPSGSVLRLAVSHLNDRKIGATLRAVAARGVRIEILAHDTERRVPQWVEEQLLESLTFRRYRHPQGLPMHNKFILIHTPQQREVLLGSMNLSVRSLYVNHELLLVSSNPLLVEAMERRWHDMQNLLDESMTS
ncbi:MAG: phospholipase D-like domain-containing protein, partial [Desulfuromonadaceae bacterium]